MIFKIIKDYLRKQGYDVESVKAKVGTRLEGYGPGEHNAAYFDGYDVKIKKKDRSDLDYGKRTISSQFDDH